MMTDFKKMDILSLIKDSFFYGLSKLIPGLFGLISVIFFFRWVGAEEYGQYSIIFSFTNLIAAFSFGWLNQSILRYGSSFSSENKIVYPLIIGSVYGVSFIISILAIGSYFYFPTKFPLTTTILLAGSIAVFNQIKTRFQSKESPKNVVLITSLQSFLMFAFAFFTTRWIGANAVSLLLGLAFGYLIPSIFCIKRIHLGQIWTDKNKLMVKKFFNYGAPLSLWFGIQLSLNFSDRFFIEQFYGPQLMGSFAGFSEFIIRVFSIIIFPVTLAIHPKVMNQWNRNQNTHETFRHILNGGLLQIVIFSGVLVLALVFKHHIFNAILSLVSGIDMEMERLLIPLLIGGFLWQFGLIVHKPLEVAEKTKKMVLCILGALAINIIGNYIFLPKYGLIVTAYTMIASGTFYILSTVMFSTPFRRRIHSK